MTESNIRENIGNFILLKSMCFSENNKLIDLLNRNRMEFHTDNASFFTTMSDVVDIFIVNLVNETICNSSGGRNYIKNIINEIKIKINNEEHEYDFFEECKKDVVWELIEGDIVSLFSDRIDLWMAKSIHLFTVMSYSTFEFWMSKLYDDLKKSQGETDKRKKKIAALIRRYAKAGKDDFWVNQLSEELRSKFFSFVSGADKIDYVISRSSIEDKERTRNIIKNCRIIRNTLHNMGYHKGDPFSFSIIKGRHITADSDGKLFTDNYNDRIYLICELVREYSLIINNINFSHTKSVLLNG